ncbi:DUF2393 domain-containing protein [Sulfurimonas sp.]|jgi:hypothetical protein|uniref:DUF2393 domain-containing protein n=1 Tax=Sulfurimonas sp. TaxID=2022749 RepID=UPI0025EA26AE|nr:DUF2393 domain-containing protein [Sulfurimonas sp.]MCK9472158.1 DUF2393 domain-containing protein [Sulfurimonas sp.]MDD3505650.1 DUF2393 domain-containing protein [Sulfurimonas sp.]
MTQRITEFINKLITYDYILFGSLLFVFILFIILGILLRNRVALALFFILFAFIELLVGSTYGYIKMHEWLFKNETSIISQKKLNFTQAVVVYGVVKNSSDRDFSSCKITAKTYKISSNKLKDAILKFKPLNKMSIIEEDIAKGQEREVKIIIEPFTYGGDYNVTLGADCR